MPAEKALELWMQYFALWLTYPVSSKRAALARRHMRKLSRRYTLTLAHLSHQHMIRYQIAARARLNHDQ